MKRRVLIHLLETAGYCWIREGDHTTMYKPGIPRNDPVLRGLIQIPRHAEINEITAKAILRQAGIKTKKPEEQND